MNADFNEARLEIAMDEVIDSMSAILSAVYKPSHPVRIILDTDIGPDCDDAGAVAVLHALAGEGEAVIAGMMHCTSSRWGAGCLDAFNIFYGRPDIPVGTLKTAGFLDGNEKYEKYNKGIAVGYPNRFRDAPAPDAVGLYRKLLAESEDNETVVVAIGPLINLMQLLRSGADEWSGLRGAELVARKVKLLVCMGGQFPEGQEWNFKLHPASAVCVAKEWPTPIVFAGFEIGGDIHTGKRLFADLPPAHPIRQSYAWYVGEGQSRKSWDLTAVLFAVRGASPYWRLARGTINIDAETGTNGWTDGIDGPHAYIVAESEPEEVAKVLEALMVR